MGVFKRPGSKHYWFRFFHAGRRIQQSTGQGDREVAKSLEAAERVRLLKVDAGLEPEIPLATQRSITVAELLDSLRSDYELRGKGSVQNLGHIRRAKADFGNKMASALTAADIKKYQKKRQEKGVADATVNRTTEIIRQAYTLAKLTPPDITRFEENNARSGFFTREQFDKVMSFLPADLRDFCLFAYLTGMRRGELKSLTWSNVSENIIRLPGVDAKTKKPRTIVATGELADLLRRRREARSVKTKDGALMAANLFHRNGEWIGEYRKSWNTACVAAQMGTFVCRKCKKEGAGHWCPDCKLQTRYRGSIFHDLRRTGVRNLIRAGVPQNVAMKISGHRTEATFRRYDICNEEDLAQAMVSLQKYHQAQQQKVVSMSEQ